MECADWFAEWEVCGEDPSTIPLTVLLHLDHLFVQNLHLFNIVWGAGVPLYYPFTFSKSVGHLMHHHVCFEKSGVF